jgi:probable HAF family extracellular repeat protein
MGRVSLWSLALRISVLCLALAACARINSARASGLYSFKDLGQAPDVVYGINNSGQMIGLNRDPATGQLEAAAISHGVVIDFATLDHGAFSGNFVALWGINDSGQVVGQKDNQGFTYNLNTGQSQFLGYDAFAVNNAGQVAVELSQQNLQGSLYDPRTHQFTSLGSLGGGGVTPIAMNDAGQVTGMAALANGEIHAFLYSNGKLIDLGSLSPGQPAVGRAISSDGKVVGESGSQLFLYANGKMTPLSFPPQTGIASINSLEQILGNHWTPSGTVPFLYNAKTGVYQDLINLLPPAASSWTLEGALRIDDQGNIFGFGFENGQRHGFELSPQNVPEPSTIVIFVFGTVAVMTHAGRKQRGVPCRGAG